MLVQDACYPTSRGYIAGPFGDIVRAATCESQLWYLQHVTRYPDNSEKNYTEHLEEWGELASPVGYPLFLGT